MSNWNATKRLPRLVQPPRYARNGQLVTSAFYSKIAESINHISAYRRKLVGSYSQKLSSPVAAASGTNTTWRSYFRTGHGVEKLAVRLLMGSNASATAPAVTIALINPTTGATIDSFTRYVGDTDIAHVPGEWVDASGYLAVSDDTAYGIDWNVTDYARLYSGTAYEIGTAPVSDATTGSVDPRYSVGGPILDAQPLAMAQGLTECL